VRLVVLLLVVASCGAPARIDLRAFVGRRGAEEARRDLVIRVLADPRDIQAHLALAELDVKLGLPSEAIEHLETVEHQGGPLGIRWHDADRARLARLVLARGRARLARASPTALADLERARSLGAAPRAEEVERARFALALAQLRHVDAKLRAKGRATLAAANDPRWAGARPDAPAAAHGAFGAWLWTMDARRESYEQLAAWHAATRPPRDETLQAAYLRALAWWSPLWLGEVPPPPAEDLVGPERCWFPGTDCTPPVPPASEPAPVPTLDADPRAAIAARYASRFAEDPARLVPIASAHVRDPAIAERLARELVARAPDAALANATLGALYDALGDPARARSAWQAAVDGSPEPAFQRGLAEATARGGDAPAALVFATTAAAASGDPAVVWTVVAAALVGTGKYVEALTAARSALDLAGPEVLPRALDVAIAASRALSRRSQADALLVQRAQLAVKTLDTEVSSALLAHREQPTASTIAGLWVVSRDHPRDVELRAALLESLDPDDPRRETVTAELVALAGDSDPERALAAVAALR